MSRLEKRTTTKQQQEERKKNKEERKTHHSLLILENVHASIQSIPSLIRLKCRRGMVTE